VKRFGLLHNEELDVYRSAGVVRVVKCGRLRWARHVAGMAKTNAYRITMRKPFVNVHLEYQGGRILEDNVEIDLRKVCYENRRWRNWLRTAHSAKF